MHVLYAIKFVQHFRPFAKPLTPVLCKLNPLNRDISYNSGSANVRPTKSAPQIAWSCGASKSALVQFLPAVPTCPIKPARSFFPFSNMPNRRPTSVTVTPILTTMRTIMIHVIVLIFVSAILSLRISASSKNTLHRSFRTLMRGVISRYSRIAK